MSPTAEKTPDPVRVETGEFDVRTALREAERIATGRPSFYRAALRELSRYFDSPIAAIHIDLASGAIDDVVQQGSQSDSTWTKICRDLLLDVRYRNRAMTKLFHASGVDQRFVVMGVPITDQEAVGGALVVVSRCETKSQANQSLAELKSIQAELASMAEFVGKRVASASKCHVDSRTGAPRPDVTPPSRTRHGMSTSMDAFAKMNRYESIHEFAFNITNGLKSQLNYDEVSLGIVRERSVELLAISGHDHINTRSQGVRLIVDALEECFDAKRPIIYDPKPQDAGRSLHFLHKRWFWDGGKAPVASIPLQIDNECVAVLGLRQQYAKSIAADDITKLESSIAPLLPGMLLLDRASQSPLRVLARSCTKKLRQAGTIGKGIPALIALLLLMWTCFGTLPYRITVPCSVVSPHVRHIAAPFEGPIATAKCEPGELVTAGQKLIEFDTRDLRMKDAQLVADIRIAELEMESKLVAKDSMQAAQVAQRIESLRAQRAMVWGNLNRSVIKAPFTAIVVSGDPMTRIGEVVPLGETLLQLAPADELRLELATPEHSAPWLNVGQQGTFVSRSHPDIRHEFEIENVHSTASALHQAPVFLAEGKLDGEDNEASRLRVGMTGFARVTTEPRPVWWIWSHRLLEFLQLQAWKL